MNFSIAHTYFCLHWRLSGSFWGVIQPNIELFHASASCRAQFWWRWTYTSIELIEGGQPLATVQMSLPIYVTSFNVACTIFQWRRCCTGLLQFILCDVQIRAQFFAVRSCWLWLGCRNFEQLARQCQHFCVWLWYVVLVHRQSSNASSSTSWRSHFRIYIYIYIPHNVSTPFIPVLLSSPKLFSSIHSSYHLVMKLYFTLKQNQPSKFASCPEPQFSPLVQSDEEKTAPFNWTIWSNWCHSRKESKLFGNNKNSGSWSMN